MTITIWHNPRCGKSRQTLELLRRKGIEPTIREYLKQPPSKAEVEKLIDLVGGDAKDLIRDGEPEFRSSARRKPTLANPTLPRRSPRIPILLQRPIVVSGKRAAIGRPPEAVLPLLK